MTDTLTISDRRADMVPREMRGRASELPIETPTTIRFKPGMVSDEKSEQVPISGSAAADTTPIETPGCYLLPGEDEPTSAPPAPVLPPAPEVPSLPSVQSGMRYATKTALWDAYQLLAQQGISQKQAAARLGVSNATLSRMTKAVERYGLDGLKDRYGNCGRKPALALTPEEEQRLSALYLRTNRTADAGSMQTACKFFAHDPATREELRCAILSALERGRIPRFAARALQKITALHFAMYRKPSKAAANHLSGRRGSFLKDKEQRLRIVESDDATLNFPAWIPWTMGGDPISDKYGVRLGRWQFLPALEAGWSHKYLGYSLVARPRGSYTQEDVRGVIQMVVEQHGYPDGFRFERGTWESNSIKELLERLGIDLNTVYQSNQKPFIEGGFSKLWTYLSVVDGQVGRFQGEMEKANLDMERCRAGRLDPREVFPALTQCTKALDGALALHNADNIKSHYGSWIPDVRYREHAIERPWRQLQPELKYLFAPVVREWTVQKGHVGGHVTLTDDLKAPFYFFDEELWRFNGQKVRVHFDPAAKDGTATITAINPHLCFSPGDVISASATLSDAVSHFTRAAMGWQDLAATPAKSPSHRGPLSQVRRETRALVGGRVRSATSEEMDGTGQRHRIERSSAPSDSAPAKKGRHSVYNPFARQTEPASETVEQPRIVAVSSRVTAPEPEPEEIEVFTNERPPQEKIEIEEIDL